MSEQTPIPAEALGIDPQSSENMLEVVSTLKQPFEKMPLVIAGPWTREARSDAAKGDVKLAMRRYFSDAMKNRNWTPWDDFPLEEMSERGHLLSEDTVTIIQAYLGVEDYVGDYVLDGLNLIGKERERRDAHLVWGMEEAKHAAAWEEVLLHSGRKTQKELDEYREKVAEHTWTMREDHPGLDTSMGFLAYAMLQERATFFNYDELRKRIRQEYKLPEKITPEERSRKMEIGAAGAFKTVSIDEIAHHGLFLELSKIYTRYLPEDMLQALTDVFNGFHMPALQLIPDGADLEEAMRNTGIHTARNQVTNVNNPALNALGFESRRALERAAQEAKILPDADLGPQYVAVSPSGEFVLSMEPENSTHIEVPSSGVVFQKGLLENS